MRLGKPLRRLRAWLGRDRAAEARSVAARLDHLSWRIDYLHRETRILLGRLGLPAKESWAAPQHLADGAPATDAFSSSVLCRQADFEQPFFGFWTRRLGTSVRYHRKLWEHVFIAQSLWERGAIALGARGLGFGVGREPLAALFASEGCRVTATDIAPELAAQKGWSQSAQHAASLESLRNDRVCPAALFDQGVEYRVCDMNDIPASLTGYDFCWSSCALEHLGSLRRGAAFIERSMKCLRPGGWAVHTTEYNLSSDSHTLEQGGTVLYRRQDLEALARRLEAQGHEVAPLDLHPGDQALDDYIDVPPYRAEPHLRLSITGYACTSVGLIVRRRPAD
jgi:2-polyprenyl-3-methyl-5-hydroxy-6-metoxy-1,4-benzoquinol methylase